MAIEVFACEQNTPEWAALRRGLVTASEIDTVLAQGRKKGEPSITRQRYLYRLAAERAGATPADGYSNAHMERGHVMESEARDLYAFAMDVEPELVGFIKNRDVGCSPDGLVGDAGMIEIKSKLPHLQMEVLIRGVVPAEHLPQIQCQLWVAEREFVDFVSYWPGLRPLIKRVGRDESYIAELARAVAAFNEEVAAVVEQYQRYGVAA